MIILTSCIQKRKEINEDLEPHDPSLHGFLEKKSTKRTTETKQKNIRSSLNIFLIGKVHKENKALSLAGVVNSVLLDLFEGGKRIDSLPKPALKGGPAGPPGLGAPPKLPGSALSTPSILKKEQLPIFNSKNLNDAVEIADQLSTARKLDVDQDPQFVVKKNDVSEGGFVAESEVNNLAIQINSNINDSLQTSVLKKDSGEIIGSIFQTKTIDDFLEIAESEKAYSDIPLFLKMTSVDAEKISKLGRYEFKAIDGGWYEVRLRSENRWPVAEWMAKKGYNEVDLPPARSKNYEGDFRLFEYLVNVKKHGVEDIINLKEFSSLPKAKLQKFIETELGIISKARLLEIRKSAVAAVSEEYTTTGYYPINSAYNALKNAGIDLDNVSNLRQILEGNSKIVDDWQSILKSRYDRAYDTASISEKDLWNKFIEYAEKAQLLKKDWDLIPANINFKLKKVIRGDTLSIVDSLPVNFKNLKPGTNSLSETTFTWPAIMSTTYGSAAQNNFVGSKQIVWDINLPDAHRGKSLRGYASEKEITFPEGTSLRIDSITLREGDFKNFESEIFGNSSTYIIKATMIK